ncbi:MAG: MoaD/ThiS family protein [Actinobacteria bacterium]|nr:MoaD/ThiS family protein [Actinomycetota bacterium]
MVRVRLFAALREMAGAPVVEVAEAGGGSPTVRSVVDALAERYGERFSKVARAGSAVVNGERAEPGRVLSPEDEVALLPPVSGGRR